MKETDKLFFELIRVAISAQESLSRIPSECEWGKLFKMAEKQSLIGICFAGLQSLGANADDGFSLIGMDEVLYLTWMGMALQIQQKNETLNHQCANLQAKLSADGYKGCILKGQSVASLYGSQLSGLRQSGDIDMWMVAEPEIVIEWARATGSMHYYDYHHADLSLFPETEIELHYRPSISRNLVRNARLQKWFKEEGVKHIIKREDLGFAVPDYTFSVMLTMNHNFWHLLYEGVGMRQMIDLYYVLRHVSTVSMTIPDGQTAKAKQEVSRLLKHLKLERFSSASMWIMKEIFGLEDQYLLCEPNERAGRFLLEEIMQAGNFGKHDERLKDGRYKSRWRLMLTWTRHTFRLFKYYPDDVLWAPIGIIRISLWRRWHYRIENGLKNKKK